MNNNGTAACRECKKPVGPSVRFEKKFCCHACGTAWNNRRKQRGAEMYDLIMFMCCERKAARLLNIWTLVWRMAAVWREEDKAAGLKSYAPFAEIQQDGRMLKYAATRHDISRRVR